jgi:uncharacterized delta-60 repeat protein
MKKTNYPLFCLGLCILLFVCSCGGGGGGGAPATVSLTAAANPSAYGWVVPSGTYWYNLNDVVTLVAIANGGYEFSSWSGDLTGSENPTTIIMNRNKSITANFVGAARSVTVSSAYGEPNPPVGTTWYHYGDSVTVRCGSNPYPPDAIGTRYACTGWTGGTGNILPDGVATSVTFIITQNCTITWTWKTQYYLETFVLPIFPVNGGTVQQEHSDGWYDEDTSVQVTAIPLAPDAFSFTLWSGDLTTDYNPDTVDMDEPKSVTANFVILIPHTITVTSDYGAPIPPVEATPCPDGYPATLSCGPNPYPPDAIGTRYVCIGWEGGSGNGIPLTGTQTSYTISSVIEDSAITWVWKTQYQLSVTKNPSPGGDVTLTSSPPPESGGWYDRYEPGTVVSCNATPRSGYNWMGWDGDLAGDTRPQNLTMNGPKSIIANFEGEPRSVTVFAPPSSSPDPPVGTTWYHHGDSVTVSCGPTPLSGPDAGTRYACTGWTVGTGNIDPSGSATSITFTITQNCTITWVWQTQYRLVVSINPPGSGTVTHATGWYGAGTVLSVSATPNDGYRWVCWSGDMTGDQRPQNLTMNGAKSITGNFTPDTYDVTVSSARGEPRPSGTTSYAGSSSVTVSCGPTPYPLGATSTRYVCTGWTGGSGDIPATGTGTSRTFTITRNCTITWTWKTQYQLITAVEPAVGGSITPTSGSWYDLGTVITCNATGEAGYGWIGWSGDLSGMQRPQNVTMNSPKSVTANFVRPTLIVSSPVGSATGDFWLLKLNSNGTVSWEKTYGGSSQDVASSIQQTSDGGYIVAGWTDSFGADNRDFWVLKLNSDGTVAWQKRYGGANNDYADSIQQTSDSGYIVAGWTDSFGADNRDFWVLKLNSDGTVAWQKRYGGADEDCASSIRQTSDGGYIVAGCTWSFGASNYDFWVLRLSSDGAISWQKRYGSANNDYANSIYQTGDSGYIVAGYTESFGSGGRDFWVLKLKPDDALVPSNNGAVDWQYSYGGANDDQASSIQQTSDGGYIVAGYTDSFGSGGRDFWVLKLNSDGTVSWQKTYGGASLDCATSIRQTSDGYIVAGYTESFGSGGRDFWVLKLNSNGTIAFDQASGAQVVSTSVTPADTSASVVADTTATEADTSASVTDTKATVVDTNATVRQQASPTLWAKSYGGEGIEEAYSIQQTSDGHYIVAGDTWSFGAGNPRPHGGTYAYDYGTGVTCRVTSPSYPTPQFTEGFEAGNVDGWITTTGTRAWFATTPGYTGIYSARSGSTVLDGEESYIQRTFTVGAEGGTVAFWWKVSSESWDYLEFYVDAEPQWRVRISGEVDWTEVTLPLEAGPRTLKWRYKKDMTDSGGEDCGWVDDILVPTATSDRSTRYICTGYTGTGSCPSGTGSSVSFVIVRNSSVTWNWLIQHRLTVDVDPADSGSVLITFPQSGDGYYDEGTVVTLVADASIGYVFDHWSGDLTGTDFIQYLTIDGPKDVTANFVGPNKVSNLTGTADSESAITWSWTSSNTDWQEIAAGVLRTVAATLQAFYTSYGDLPESETCPRDGSGNDRLLFEAADDLPDMPDVQDCATISVAAAGTYTITYTKLSPSTWTCTADTDRTDLNDYYIDQTSVLKEEVSTGDGAQANSGSSVSLENVWFEIQSGPHVGPGDPWVGRVYPNITSWQETTGLLENTQYTRHVHSVSSGVYSDPSNNASCYTYVHNATIDDFSLVVAGGNETSSKTIGTGTVSVRYPIDIAYNYARCQMLYLASEMGQAARITRLRFQRYSGDVDTVNTVEVHMDHTTASSIAAWQSTSDPAAPHTLVYSGNLSIPSDVAGTWFEIPLTTWFDYNGTSNLIISFRHQDGSWESAYTRWRADNTKTGRCVAGYSNNVMENPPTVTGTNIYLPNVGFEIAGTVTITVTAPLNPAVGTTGVRIEWDSSDSFPAPRVVQDYTPTYTSTDKVGSGEWFYRIRFRNADGVATDYSEGKSITMP